MNASRESSPARLSAIVARATVSFLAAAFFTVASAEAADLTGTWLTEKREALIRISPCGGGLCGTVTWLAEPNDPATGRPKTDDKNHDPSRRSRPLLGSRVFYNMRPSGPDQWTGQIYSVDDGITVQGQLMATGPDQMRIQGCVLGICSGENWTRRRGR
jgi:uncharacterized protein (DUF2147 family)